MTDLPPMRTQAAARLANDMIAGSVKSPDWPENVQKLQEAQRRGEYELPITARRKAMDELIAGDVDLYDAPEATLLAWRYECMSVGIVVVETPGNRWASTIGWTEISRYASARIKGDKDRENPVERPQPLETQADLSNELVELAYQYLRDLRYPPFGDSKARRIERIKTVLEAIEKVKML
jgi:hypothetical protein